MTRNDAVRLALPNSMVLVTMQTSMLVVLTFGLAVSSCAQMDHSVNAQLGRELAERSKNGLGLARFSEASNVIEIRYFDGSTEKVPLEIDGELKVATQGGIAVLNLDSSIRRKMADAALQGNGALYLQEFARLGGNIFLLSKTGKIERRSAVNVNASVIAVSGDGQRLAFVGVPQGISESEYGVYVADFDSTRPLRILAFGSDNPRRQQDGLAGATLDWSPLGRKLLFSYRETITMFDVDAGSSQEIADGGSAQWSPSGDWISFVGPGFAATLMELSTGKTLAIDPGFEVTAIGWSPDGSYLLIPEGKGSHVPYGCHWVYRISDKAFFPVCEYHLVNPLPFWIQTGRVPVQ